MNLRQKTFLLVCSVSMAVMAQEPSPNAMVRTWTEGAVSPAATLKNIQWMVGDWEGEVDGSMGQSAVY